MAKVKLASGVEVELDDLMKAQVTTVIDGRETPVTIEEALRGYNKGTVAEKRFAEAARGRHLQELMERAQNGDTEAATEFIERELGLGAGAYARMQRMLAAGEPSSSVGGYGADEEGDEEDAVEGQDPRVDQLMGVIEQLSTQVKQLSGLVNNTNANDVFRKLDEALDKDRAFGIIRKEKGDKAAERVRLRTREVLVGILNKQRPDAQFDPRWLTDAVKEVSDELVLVGAVRGDALKDPEPPKPTPLASMLSMGPGAGGPANLVASPPPGGTKRPAMSDPTYDDAFRQTMMAVARAKMEQEQTEAKANSF